MAPTCAITSVRIVGGSTSGPDGERIEIRLVRRDVLQSDDALVHFELGDAIDEKKRVAVRKNLFNRRVVERQRQRFHRD